MMREIFSSRISQRSSPPMITDRVGRSTIAPGPKVADELAQSQRVLACHGRPSILDRTAVGIAQLESDIWLDVPHGAGRDETAMAR